MMQEVKLLSERQEVLKGLVEDKIRLQSRATEKSIFEEMKELEEKKSKEALLLVQKKRILMRYQSARDKAKMLQGSGSSKVTRKGMDIQDLLSFEPCRSSVVDDMEEVGSKASRAAVTGRKENEGWRLEPEGETETPEVTVLCQKRKRSAK